MFGLGAWADAIVASSRSATSERIGFMMVILKMLGGRTSG
jgi:hypothetical protein